MTQGRVIAIGDIHGCSRALASLLRAVQPGPNDVIVPVGDMVDRGPDSRGVLQELLDLERICTVVPLLGNHEEMLLAARTSSVEFRAWMSAGAAETLASYGKGGMELIPAEHIAFLKRCQEYYENETHIVVHANYDPRVPICQQPPHVLRWPFLHHSTPGPHCSGKVVVMGHSPQPSGDILDLGYLKCIETDCVRGGWLTALDLKSETIWQANQSGRVRT